MSLPNWLHRKSNEKQFLLFPTPSLAICHDTKWCRLRWRSVRGQVQEQRRSSHPPNSCAMWPGASYFTLGKKVDPSVGWETQLSPSPYDTCQPRESHTEVDWALPAVWHYTDAIDTTSYWGQYCGFNQQIINKPKNCMHEIKHIQM